MSNHKWHRALVLAVLGALGLTLAGVMVLQSTPSNAQFKKDDSRVAQAQTPPATTTPPPQAAAPPVMTSRSDWSGRRHTTNTSVAPGRGANSSSMKRSRSTMPAPCRRSVITLATLGRWPTPGRYLSPEMTATEQCA